MGRNSGHERSVDAALVERIMLSLIEISKNTAESSKQAEFVTGKELTASWLPGSYHRERRDG
jgi:hypothetical protein